MDSAGRAAVAIVLILAIALVCLLPACMTTIAPEGEVVQVDPQVVAVLEEALQMTVSAYLERYRSPDTPEAELALWRARIALLREALEAIRAGRQPATE